MVQQRSAVLLSERCSTVADMDLVAGGGTTRLADAIWWRNWAILGAAQLTSH